MPGPKELFRHCGITNRLDDRYRRCYIAHITQTDRGRPLYICVAGFDEVSKKKLHGLVISKTRCFSGYVFCGIWNAKHIKKDTDSSEASKNESS